MRHSQILTHHDGVKELVSKVLQMSSLDGSHCLRVVLQMDTNCEALIANYKVWGVLSHWSGMEEKTTR